MTLNHRDMLDPALASIQEAVEGGKRLTFEQALQLYRSPDLFTLGRLADLVKRRQHQDRVYYNVNRHINYTNQCVLRCKFCAFYRPYDKDHADPTAYELSQPEIVKRASEAYAHGATEVHIVGGLHPTLPFTYYEDMLRGIREACPRIHIKAFTAVEIVHFCRVARPRLTVPECLLRLRAAGLDSMPGGGAEIFDDRVHGEAFRHKVGEADWFDVHDTAHGLGLPTNVTMLYGHIENEAERIRHLIKIRDHQDASQASRKACFNACVPLSFIPKGSDFEREGVLGPTGLTDLKTLALTRLVLDNVPHIKAFWIMQGVKLAQIALRWGCDDLDGTVQWYDITKQEGEPNNRTHQELSVDQLRRLILETGSVPVERDSLYRPVERFGPAPQDWRVRKAEKNVSGQPGL